MGTNSESTNPKMETTQLFIRLFIMLVVGIIITYVYCFRRIDLQELWPKESTELVKSRIRLAEATRFNLSSQHFTALNSIKETPAKGEVVPEGENDPLVEPAADTEDPVTDTESSRKLFVRQWHIDLDGRNNNQKERAARYKYPLRWLNAEDRIIRRADVTNYNFIVLAVRYNDASGEFVLLTTVHAYEQRILRNLHQDQTSDYFELRNLIATSLSVQFIYNLSGEEITSLPVACRYEIIMGTNEFWCKWPEFPAASPPNDLIIHLNYHGPISDFQDIAKNKIRRKYAIDRYYDNRKSVLGKLRYSPIWSLAVPVISSLDPVTTVAFCSATLYSSHYVKSVRAFLDYHLFMGVERFTIYDRFRLYYNTLKPYIDAGIVDYQNTGSLSFKDSNSAYYDQTYMMEECRYRYYASASWMGFWDFDEYIVVPVDTNHVDPPDIIDANDTSKLNQTKLFGSTCLNYNPKSGILELDYEGINMDRISESLISHPFTFRKSPTLYDASTNTLPLNISTSSLYLERFAGHCRSLLSDFFIQQTIRSHQVDLFLENVIVNTIQFVDPIQKDTSLLNNSTQRDEPKGELSFPERYNCYDCYTDYTRKIKRLDPFKSFYPPQGNSHFNIHTTAFDQRKYTYNNNRYIFRAIGKERGPLPSDQLFFAHYRNAIRNRERTLQRRSPDTRAFWQEPTTTMSLIKAMKMNNPQS